MRSVEKKSTGKRVWEVLLVLAAAAVFFWLLAGMCRMTGAGSSPERVTPLEDGWYYWKDGVKTDVTLPTTILQEEGPLILYNDSLTEEAAGMTITTRGAQYGLQIALGDQVLYEYSDEYFPRNNQMKSKHDCDAAIPSDANVGTLTLTYEAANRGKFQISSVYIGSGGAVMWHHFVNAAVTMGIAFIFVILGVIAVGVSVYLRCNRIDGRRFLDTAIFLFICSIWFVTDSSITQKQAGNAAAVCIVSFYAFMLLAVPMLHFLKGTGEMKKYRVLDWLIWAFCLNATVQGLLNLKCGIAFRDMLLVTHLLLLVGVVISAILMIKEFKKNKTREIGMILSAFVILGASGVLSLFLYWLLEIPYYGSIFEFGILIFVVLIIANIVMTMAENIHYKTEMQVYQRMAREDWMTGMENRQPFEERLAQIQRTISQYENVALIFMNLNRLKRTNDESGHAAGDELILGAAKCITAVFGAAGTCYRLGGDEFGVILPDPQGTEQEWFEKFDQEIQRYNRNSRYRLAVARGWSDLRQKDGSWKTVSDWKYQANYKLYKDKGGMTEYENV